MELTGRRILVTGGAGFIGSHVVDALIASGNRVRVLDDFSTGSRDNLTAAMETGALEIVEGDISAADTARQAVDDISVVFHMAVSNLRMSLIDPWESHRVNAGGTLSMLEASRGAGVERFVYCSSSEVYGTAVEAPMSESHPLSPTTVYGAAKLAGEGYSLAMWRTYGFPVIVVRPFNTYGDREHLVGPSGEVIPRMVLRALNGMPPVIFGDGSQSRDFLYVTETAAGLLACAAADALVGTTVNVARGEEVTISDLARTICDMCSPGLMPELRDARPGDVDRHWADTSKARDLAGFTTSIGIADGLQMYVDWFKGTGVDVAALVQHEPVANWDPA